MAIEKVIHQIWDGDNVPFQLRILSCTWKRFNPNWEYHLWNKKEMVELVDSYFQSGLIFIILYLLIYRDWI